MISLCFFKETKNKIANDLEKEKEKVGNQNISLEEHSIHEEVEEHSNSAQINVKIYSVKQESQHTSKTPKSSHDKKMN
jgi:uncharacterized protein YdgA (DUF945 family)